MLSKGSPQSILNCCTTVSCLSMALSMCFVLVVFGEFLIFHHKTPRLTIWNWSTSTRDIDSTCKPPSEPIAMVNYPSPYMLGFSLKQQTEWAARIHILPNQKPQIRTSLNTATHLTFPSFPISGQVAVRLSPSDPFPMLQSEDCLRQTHIYYAQVVLSTKHIRNIRKVLSEGETKQVCPCLNLKRTDSHSICIYLSLNASLMDKTYAIFISTVAIACVYINTIYIYIYTWTFGGNMRIQAKSFIFSNPVPWERRGFNSMAWLLALLSFVHQHLWHYCINRHETKLIQWN